MFLFNPGCPCCNKKDTPDISPGGGGWECGRCTSVPIRYKLTVPDTSGASLTVTAPAAVDDALGRPVTGPIDVEIQNVASYGGEHVLRRGRSRFDQGIPARPWIDDEGYFVFYYDSTGRVNPGETGDVATNPDPPDETVGTGNRILCDWFGEPTGFDLPDEVSINGQVFEVDGLLGRYQHFWRMRMANHFDYYTIRVEGPSVFEYPNYYQGMAGVRYEVDKRDFNCNGTTVLTYATNNPRASGWPETVTVEAILDE